MIDLNNAPELDESLELFFYAFRNFTALPDQMLAQRGLQRVHHRILFFVGRYPALSVNQLLTILAVSKQALNTPLRQLVEQGYVESRTAENDRRMRELRLTASGEELLGALNHAQRHFVGAVFADVGEEGQQTWNAIMRRMAEMPTPAADPATD